jgi:rubredoxin
MERGRNMTVSECARIQGYLANYYKWHPDPKHNYFMLGNTMSICVFQRLLVAALRCIGYHAPDPWLSGDAQKLLREEALTDFHPEAKLEQLRASAEHFTLNPPPANPDLPPNCGCNRLKHNPNSCGHIYDPDTDGGGMHFNNLPPEWTCPACGELGTKFYSDVNAISPYGGLWACAFIIRPKPVNTIDKYTFKDPKSIRTIPVIPSIPRIKRLAYEGDFNELAEEDDSPRSNTSSKYAASEAPSHHTELGSDDGNGHLSTANQAE